MPTTIFHSLKILTLIQIGVGIGFSLLIWWIWGARLGASFAIGAGLMLANLALLSWTSWRLIAKKPIAWTVLIIVIKYAVLLGSVVYFARMDWFDSLGAGLGVASFVIAVLGAAIITTKSASVNIERIKQKKKRSKERTNEKVED